jgi:hypothetical protein
MARTHATEQHVTSAVTSRNNKSAAGRGVFCVVRAEVLLAGQV